MRAVGRWQGPSGPQVPVCDLIKADLISLFLLESSGRPHPRTRSCMCAGHWTWTHVSALGLERCRPRGPARPPCSVPHLVQFLAVALPPGPLASAYSVLGQLPRFLPLTFRCCQFCCDWLTYNCTQLTFFVSHLLFVIQLLPCEK